MNLASEAGSSKTDSHVLKRMYPRRKEIFYSLASDQKRTAKAGNAQPVRPATVSNREKQSQRERENHFAQLSPTPLCWSIFQKAGATNTACEEIIEARRSFINKTLQFPDTDLWMLLGLELKPSNPSQSRAQFNKY